MTKCVGCVPRTGCGTRTPRWWDCARRTAGVIAGCCSRLYTRHRAVAVNRRIVRCGHSTPTSTTRKVRQHAMCKAALACWMAALTWPCSQRWHRALPKLATPTPRCSQSRVATALVSGLHQSTPQRPRPPLMLVPIAACGLVLCVCACTLAAMLAVHPIKVVEQNDQDFERGMLIVKVHGML